jgi:hypothetical protein
VFKSFSHSLFPPCFTTLTIQPSHRDDEESTDSFDDETRKTLWKDILFFLWQWEWSIFFFGQKWCLQLESFTALKSRSNGDEVYLQEASWRSMSLNQLMTGVQCFACLDSRTILQSRRLGSPFDMTSKRKIPTVVEWSRLMPIRHCHYLDWRWHFARRAISAWGLGIRRIFVLYDDDHSLYSV